MKTKNVIFIIILSSFFLLQNINAQQWGYTSNMGKEMMRKIFTRGAEAVYIVGENGLIAKSENQGKDWTKRYHVSGTHLNDILFTDEHTGFAIGENGIILKTTDSGDNWETQNSPVNETFYSIALNDAGLWVVGENGIVLQSADNGTNWQSLDIIGESIRLNGIGFKDNTGYIVGDDGLVYYSEDNGANWIKESIAGIDDNYNFTSIDIVEDKIIIQSKNYNKGYLVKEDNSWTYNDIYHFHVYNLHFVNSLKGFLSSYDFTVGSDKIIIIVEVTEDGGRNWEQSIIKYGNLGTFNPYFGDQFYFDMTMANDTLGYAIMGEVLLRTPLPYYESTGITNNLSEATNVYYSKSTLTIESFDQRITSIEVCPLETQVPVYQVRLSPSYIHNVPVSVLPNGLYVLKVHYEDNTVNLMKWIKY